MQQHQPRFQTKTTSRFYFCETAFRCSLPADALMLTLNPALNKVFQIITNWVSRGQWEGQQREQEQVELLNRPAPLHPKILLGSDSYV